MVMLELPTYWKGLDLDAFVRFLVWEFMNFVNDDFASVFGLFLKLGDSRLDQSTTNDEQAHRDSIGREKGLLVSFLL